MVEQLFRITVQCPPVGWREERGHSCPLHGKPRRADKSVRAPFKTHPESRISNPIRIPIPHENHPHIPHPESRIPNLESCIPDPLPYENNSSTIAQRRTAPLNHRKPRPRRTAPRSCERGYARSITVNNVQLREALSTTVGAFNPACRKMAR